MLTPLRRTSRWQIGALALLSAPALVCSACAPGSSVHPAATAANPNVAPGSAASAPASPNGGGEPGLSLALTSDGRAMRGNQELTSEADVRALVAPGQARDVRIEVSGSVTNERLNSVVSALRGAGAGRIELVMVDAPPASPGPDATASAPPSAAASVAPPTQAPPAAPTLPEVVVKTIGLHIGGGPNDDAAKAPFKRVLEAGFDAFRSCYKTVNDPEKGGVFGADLLIPAEGGHPRVQQPRTAMGGPEFRQCVIDAFSFLNFARPARGPTMVSTSIRFSLDGK